MDRATFEAKVASIKKGEFTNDIALRGYISDNLLSVRMLFDALWECCDWQSQKIGILKKINRDLEDAVRRLMKERKDLKQEIKELHEQIANMDALLMAKEQGITDYAEQAGDAKT